MVVFTNQARHSVTPTNQTRTKIAVLATAGLYYGFGAFTYSGGQSLGTSPIVFTNQSRHTVSATNQTKH